MREHHPFRVSTGDLRCQECKHLWPCPELRAGMSAAQRAILDAVELVPLLKPVTIEPGKTYVVEVEQNLDPDLFQQVSEHVRETFAEVEARVIVMSGAKLARTTTDD